MYYVFLIVQYFILGLRTIELHVLIKVLFTRDVHELFSTFEKKLWFGNFSKTSKYLNN